MKFDELDRKMRVFETAADLCVLPGIYMVARLDGRSFTRLTKEVCKFAAPFDERFRDLMVATTEALMKSDFRVVYGYTESDEISLLFSLSESQFNRKLRKYNSTLAGIASAEFSLRLGQPAVFDCRIAQLPGPELVVDYFRWRNEDAARNALNAYCYWILRKQGLTQQQSTQRLMGLSTAGKNELLFSCGTNFNEVPKWQKRGIGLYWDFAEKIGRNPLTGETVTTRRRQVHTSFDLPMREEYEEFVRQLVAAA
jgi:tRNA(His) 5'-end guanylyltransferase